MGEIVVTLVLQQILKIRSQHFAIQANSQKKVHAGTDLALYGIRKNEGDTRNNPLLQPKPLSRTQAESTHGISNTLNFPCGSPRIVSNVPMITMTSARIIAPINAHIIALTALFIL